jgi:aldehyde dehydrogenase (NAD+)
MSTLDKRNFYIDGRWVQPDVPADRHVVNPATEEPLAVISLGTESDVGRAVAAAKRVGPSFSRTSRAERLELLAAIRDVYVKRRREIGHAISDELGTPIDLSIAAQAGTGIAQIDAFIEALRSFNFTQVLGNGNTVVREAAGVAGLITPWNWPINQICLKLFAALSAGCTVVLKPSEYTPLNAMILAEILEEAGCPNGAFNLVNGDGETTGRALVEHADVNVISFTGSTRAGMAIYQAAAVQVKKVSLELGGKSPCLIFADADIELAIRQSLEKVFSNSGQNCNAPTRLLVERSVYAEATAMAAQVAEKTAVGLPQLPGPHIGPVANEHQFNHIQAMIEAGIRDDAKVLAGGLGRPEGFEKGYFVRPTVFANASNDMEISREEIFGPVVVMIPFDDEAEAIQLANDSPYGLAAYVYSRDCGRLDRAVSRLQAGMVFRNGADIKPGSPFGGYKQSGIGREGGAFGIEEFLEIKLVA